MLKHLNTALRVTIVSIVLLGLVYPLAMTAMAQVLFPRQANGSLVTVNGKVVGLGDHRSVVDEAAVLPRASVGCRQGLRSDVDRRNEPWPDVKEANGRYASDDCAVEEG